MEEYIYYSDLYDIYKSLLTEKQKNYFEDYYFKNLSFSEIAENYDVSRNAVYGQVKLTKEALKDYEKKLLLMNKRRRIEKVLENNELSEKVLNIINE